MHGHLLHITGIKIKTRRSNNHNSSNHNNPSHNSNSRHSSSNSSRNRTSGLQPGVQHTDKIHVGTLSPQYHSTSYVCLSYPPTTATRPHTHPTLHCNCNITITNDDDDANANDDNDVFFFLVSFRFVWILAHQLSLSHHFPAPCLLTD